MSDNAYRSIATVIACMFVGLFLACAASVISKKMEHAMQADETNAVLTKCDATIAEANKQFAKAEAERRAQREWELRQIAIIEKERE